MQGSVGEAEIDNENRTVVITVEPMDISDISPDITISEGATITGPSSIEDGVAAVYTLTAENGDILEWEVTINVQYGVSFTVEGQKVVLTGGFKDSGDFTANEACGHGVPGIQKIDGDGMALEHVYDWNVLSEAPPYDYLDIYVNGMTTGTFKGEFDFYDYSEDSLEYFYGNIAVSEFGAIGGNFRAEFSGVNEGETKSLINGFAKLMVIEDLGFGSIEEVLY